MKTIRFYRRLRNVEQKELATFLEIDPSMICRFEKEKADIKAKDLAKVSAYLHVPIQKFFEPIPSLEPLLQEAER